MDDVSAFFKTYYAPNNAVVAIVGDVDTKTVLAKVEKYFGPIAKQPPPPKVDMTEPAQTAERRLTLEDGLARLPRLDMAYKIPDSSAPDTDALTVLGTILSGGRSSRFYENIVRQKQLATQVNAFAQETRGPGLFNVIATAALGKPLTEIETAIDAEIERVKSGPIEDWELEKARTGARRNLVGSLGSSLQRAILLSQYALFYNDPERINTRADRIAKVTAADVQRVARQYSSRPAAPSSRRCPRAPSRREDCDVESHQPRSSPVSGPRSRWRRRARSRRGRSRPRRPPRWSSRGARRCPARFSRSSCRGRRKPTCRTDCT